MVFIINIYSIGSTTTDTNASVDASQFLDASRPTPRPSIGNAGERTLRDDVDDDAKDDGDDDPIGALCEPKRRLVEKCTNTGGWENIRVAARTRVDDFRARVQG